MKLSSMCVGLVMMSNDYIAQVKVKRKINCWGFFSLNNPNIRLIKQETDRESGLRVFCS